MATERKSKAGDANFVENKHQDESPNNDAMDVEAPDDLEDAPDDLDDMSLHVMSPDQRPTGVYDPEVLQDGDVVYTVVETLAVLSVNSGIYFRQSVTYFHQV